MQVHLIGDGRTYPRLKAMAGENIIFDGWQPEGNIPIFIQHCDIGIIPHLKNEHTDHTIPHKLFQFWALMKPVIVSDCDPLKRIVEKVGGGLVFKSGDANDLRSKIEMLLNDKNLRYEMGLKGYQAVRRKYNWKTSEKQLRSIYGKAEIKIIQKKFQRLDSRSKF